MNEQALDLCGRRGGGCAPAGEEDLIHDSQDQYDEAQDVAIINVTRATLYDLVTSTYSIH